MRRTRAVFVVISQRRSICRKEGLFRTGGASPRRFAEAVGIVDEVAEQHDRADVGWQHGYQPWIGVGDTPEEARAFVASAMEDFYKIPFESFEKYVPYGTPDMVAEILQPYIEAGCSTLNMQVVAESTSASIDGLGQIIAALG